MQPGARPAHLAGDHGKRDQAARIVGAVYMLRDAHAPEDDAGIGIGEETRYGAQRIRVDAADLGHCFGREILDVTPEIFEPFGMGLDVIGVI